MKEIIIPELEEEIKKLPKQYVDSESLCKIYPLRYYEVKRLAKVAFAYTALTKEVLADGE